MVDRTYYHANEMFRPAGTTPGHWLEWARLLLQLYALGGKTQAWMPEAAEALFERSMTLGWDKAKGGFFYTLDWQDVPEKRAKLWWPMCEAAGAAHFLNAHAPSAFHEESYRQIWSTISRHFLDREHGGWFEETTEDLVPADTSFPRQGRHLPCLPSLPHPAVSGNRQPYQGHPGARHRALNIDTRAWRDRPALTVSAGRRSAPPQDSSPASSSRRRPSSAS